ncbi:thiamine-binding protein [Gulosibacter molinativorax]|uniref:Thiamine-binding protein n=1 Tax=Gulosibacter molinativorax TaxID=256821 RepID=A0ABT7C3E1_9MICO|nr:thiamine-binding protein [Gulosibacter molinativorax]MDJ1369786.1 thiamine-binding protein [Gulosibacter molinativorax]QUY61751.1 S-adenosyl-L-methionine-dependent methyl transferase [Gulosibacter molinativorax]
MIAAFSIAPSGPASDPSVTADEPGSYHKAVAAALEVVRASGLPNQTDAMFTTIEGEWDEVMDVVKRATEEIGRYGSRVSLVLKADIRPGHSGEITGKVERVEEELRRRHSGN